MSKRNHASSTGVDFMITDTLEPVGELANMESMNNEDQLCDTWNLGTLANGIMWVGTIL